MNPFPRSSRRWIPMVLLGISFLVPGRDAGAQVNGTWSGGTTGNWSQVNGAGWIGGTAPDGTSDTASYLSGTAAAATTLDGNYTVAALLNKSGKAWTIGGSNALTLQSGSGLATIAVQASSSSIVLNAPLTLGGDLQLVNGTAGTQLTLNGAIGGSGDLYNGNYSAGVTLFTGAINNAGTLNFGSSTATTINGVAINAYSGGKFQLGNSTTTGLIGANVTAVNVTAGIVNVYGAQAYSAATHLSGGTVQLNNNNVLSANSALTIDSGAVVDLFGRSQTISDGMSLANHGTITNSSSTASTLTFNVSGSASSGLLSATTPTKLAVVVSGTGTVTFNAANTYGGQTRVNAGVLALNSGGGNAINASSGATGTSSDILLAGGTLRLDAADQINDAASVALNGGTFNTNGFSEGTVGAAGAGVVSLLGDSVIDMSGTSVLHFLASSAGPWAVGKVLKIYDWNGSLSGGGAEQLLFGTDDTGLTAAQLGQIWFYSDAGTTFLGTAAFSALNDGEIVAAVPEPAAWALLSLGLGAAWSAAGWRRRVA